jgi:broad specificity phosphatase PhoE
MKTKMYLIRHGATLANLAQPPRLQGQGQDLSLAPLGVRQAELTRDFLSVRNFQAIYSSPLQRALETAAIIAAPHDLRPEPVAALTECDVGRWENLSWQEIKEKEPEAYERFHDNPAKYGYPGGESLSDVHRRASKALNELFQRHDGENIIVVAHHVVNRTYLAGLLGLGQDEAREVTLANCSVSIVVREKRRAKVHTLNSTFHLQGVAAA